jgi:two-component system CheB/CheR fusion protein
LPNSRSFGFGSDSEFRFAFMSSPSQSSRRIRVVEDNLDTVHSLTLLLREMGHKVEYAINGYAAIEVARRLQPEFVFLDLGLPGMDGFEVCRRLKKEEGLQSARVIAVTGYAQEEFRQRSHEVGCEVHIIKPLDPKFLDSLLGGKA